MNAPHGSSSRRRVELLTDEALFAEGRTISVVGDRGIRPVEFADGPDAQFRVGMPVGPPFDPGKGITSLRQIEVAKLRPIFDVLAPASPR
jgi:hypothetical protein